MRKQKKPTKAQLQKELKAATRQLVDVWNDRNNEQRQRAHLTKLLTAIIARRGEPIVVSVDDLDRLPGDSVLHESYDTEAKTFTLRSVRPKQQPTIEIVQK